MLKYLIAAAAGLMLTAPSFAQSTPAPQADGRVYELRTYTAGTGCLNELHTRFREHTVRLLERHGATSLGYWVPEDNGGNKLLFLLSYPSQAARNATWSALAADPEWLRIKRQSELKEGKLVERIESTFLTATAYSPAIQAHRDPDGRLFELRTATAASGQTDALHEKLRTETLPELEKNGTMVVGVWTVQNRSNDGNTVMYLVARKPAVGESEADSVLVSLSGFGMRRPSPRPDPATLRLLPTDYSPLK